MGKGWYDIFPTDRPFIIRDVFSNQSELSEILENELFDKIDTETYKTSITMANDIFNWAKYDRIIFTSDIGAENTISYCDTFNSTLTKPYEYIDWKETGSIEKLLNV